MWKPGGERLAVADRFFKSPLEDKDGAGSGGEAQQANLLIGRGKGREGSRGRGGGAEKKGELIKELGVGKLPKMAQKSRGIGGIEFGKPGQPIRRCGIGMSRGNLVDQQAAGKALG